MPRSKRTIILSQTPNNESVSEVIGLDGAALSEKLTNKRLQDLNTLTLIPKIKDHSHFSFDDAVKIILNDSDDFSESNPSCNELSK